MCGKGFFTNYYEPGWSPIRDLVTADVTHSQLHSSTGSSQRAVSSHDNILVITYNIQKVEHNIILSIMYFGGCKCINTFI